MMYVSKENFLVLHRIQSLTCLSFYLVFLFCLFVVLDFLGFFVNTCEIRLSVHFFFTAWVKGLGAKWTPLQFRLVWYQYMSHFCFLSISLHTGVCFVLAFGGMWQLMWSPVLRLVNRSLWLGMASRMCSDTGIRACSARWTGVFHAVAFWAQSEVALGNIGSVCSECILCYPGAVCPQVKVTIQGETCKLEIPKALKSC